MTIEDDNILLIRIDERQKEMQKDITDIKEKLFGNGRKGLCDRVSKNEFMLKEIQTDTNKRIDNMKYLIMVTSSVVITVIAILNYFKI